MIDWNDLRHFLAVARTGTTLAASRQLGVSQSTVARRIDALETALGLKLFDRRQAGYALTEAGQDLIEAAASVESAASTFTDKATSLQRGITGTVRFTTNDLFANQVLLPALPAFREAHPEIRLEMVTSDRRLDLASGEADIALRAGTPPSDPALVGRCIAQDTWGVYCSRSYAERHGIPASAEDLGQHGVLGIDPQAFGGPVIDWARTAIPRSSILVHQNSVSMMYMSVRSGLGVGLVPDFVARTDREMVHCFDPKIDMSYEIWLLTHERLRNVPRVRAVLDFMTEYLTSGQHARGTTKAVTST